MNIKKQTGNAVVGSLDQRHAFTVATTKSRRLERQNIQPDFSHDKLISLVTQNQHIVRCWSGHCYPKDFFIPH